MKDDKQDIVSYFVRLVEKFCPGMDHDRALELEDQIRQDWGGSEVGYIAKKRKASPQEKDAAVQEYIAGEDTKKASKQHGISRATLYRYLKK